MTRDERGQRVSYPERTGFPKQQRPLVVLSYNIQGHAALLKNEHIATIAETINSVKADIVAINEAHRGTWQARFKDHLQELSRRTGMRAAYGRSYEQWGGEYGNAVLTRGEIVWSDVHELPSLGEPRTVLETIIRIDGATLNVYVTHLTAWGKLNRASRGEQLECLAKHVRTSRYPYILAGDINAPPEAPEVQTFRRQNAAQICGESLGSTHKVMDERIDYIFADYGWEVRSARALDIGPSDHRPVIAELFWERTQ